MLLLMTTVATPLASLGQVIDPIPGLHASIRPMSHHVPLGQPVWIRFSIENTTLEPITLTVPGSEPEIPSPHVGLPLPHIFSGGEGSAVTVTTESGRHWDQPVSYRTSRKAPILMIAPFGSVGLTIDLREFFPSLRGAGQYRIAWRPYGGRVPSDSVLINIAALKRAEITTDDGPMILRFMYSNAPLHVSNFIELATEGFYNGKTFHRLEPGYLLQGGCPRGDGTGIRTDGKRVPAEFHNALMRKGSIAMALLGDDADSASCQFFICNTRQKDWDGKYTIFAELVGEDSFATLDRLMAVDADEFGRPVRPLHIRTVRIFDAPPDELP
jgi:cyclophilin family peptidyl-prolyl cis-trans isomerase